MPVYPGAPQLSTRPRTAEGKAASSQNSSKRGLYSRHLVIRNEDPAELDALKADLRSEHQDRGFVPQFSKNTAIPEQTETANSGFVPQNDTPTDCMLDLYEADLAKLTQEKAETAGAGRPDRA
ncbi:MAG: hypothetical protein M3Y27_14260 [Acidobacteriota bacterium]|nr:hypothetical protein [Acidobacteriota bacterium]